MPTTRSKRRSEPLQSLETPPKRQRKQKPRRPRIVAVPIQDPPLRTASLSPEFKNLPPSPIISRHPEIILHIPNPKATPAEPIVTYCNASTQTDEVMILTEIQAAEYRDRASDLLSLKRNRDEESDEEPVAKRHQFSTPQNNKPNDLWMFGYNANGEHPRTAPSKSLVRSAHRQPARGQSTRHSHSPQLRTNPPKNSAFDSIKPIEQITTKRSTKEQITQEQIQQEQLQQEHGDQAGVPVSAGRQHHQQHNQETRQTRPTAPPETPRRGLFGSLRGMVNKGWGIAAGLTPRGRTDVSPNSQPAQTAQQNNIQYPQLNENTGESNTQTESAPQQNHDESLRFERSSDRYTGPSRSFDHLHYIPADAESVDKAINGEILPPARSLPPDLSPASRLKASNPQLDDHTIEMILKRRERKAALDAKRYGPLPLHEESKVAPLFGPDSHYARGTVDPRFLPPPPLFGPSKKRKADEANDEGRQSHHATVEDADEDSEMSVPGENASRNDGEKEGVGRFEAETPPMKRHKTQPPSSSEDRFPSTPRSVLRKPGIPASKGKSVLFGNSSYRDIRGHYGPAGQYKGSTFTDAFVDDNRSLSSIDHGDVISPTTRLNTLNNSGRKPVSAYDNLGAGIPVVDFTLRDPNDPVWRPSITNPRPGSFRVPDVDDLDLDESMVTEVQNEEHMKEQSEEQPEQPQTPRISHAELPAPSSNLDFASFNESSIIHESTELALDKARSKAEKYKPKSSSRLSEVSRAQSRSTSPVEDEDTMMRDLSAKSTSSFADSTTKPLGAPPQPFIPPELDNNVKGSDGMTDHEREHQYDEWAANLKWDAPQTYEDAGTGSAFIHNLIRKNWTEQDSLRSEVFWAREFDEVDRDMKAAARTGQKLELITGMEEVESY